MSLFNNTSKGRDNTSNKPQVNNNSFSDKLRDPGSARMQEDSSSESFNETPEKSSALFNRISWRLLPLLFVCYIIAYIDRINVGFAKLQLREVLGVNEEIFGAIYTFDFPSVSPGIPMPIELTMESDTLLSSNKVFI